MKTVAKPRVFISYTWRPDDSSNPSDKPQARGLELADRLRAAGLTLGSTSTSSVRVLGLRNLIGALVTRWNHGCSGQEHKFKKPTLSF